MYDYFVYCIINYPPLLFTLLNISRYEIFDETVICTGRIMSSLGSMSSCQECWFLYHILSRSFCELICKDQEENTASIFKEACLLVRCLAMGVLLLRVLAPARMCLPSRCLAIGLYVTLCIYQFIYSAELSSPLSSSNYDSLNILTISEAARRFTVHSYFKCFGWKEGSVFSGSLHIQSWNN
jgi:hypothetical protein